MGLFHWFIAIGCPAVIANLATRDLEVGRGRCSHYTWGFTCTYQAELHPALHDTTCGNCKLNQGVITQAAVIYSPRSESASQFNRSPGVTHFNGLYQSTGTRITPLKGIQHKTSNQGGNWNGSSCQGKRMWCVWNATEQLLRSSYAWYSRFGGRLLPDTEVKLWGIVCGLHKTCINIIHNGYNTNTLPTLCKRRHEFYMASILI